MTLARVDTNMRVAVVRSAGESLRYEDAYAPKK